MREFAAVALGLGARGASTATKQTAGGGGVTGSAVIIPRLLGHAVLSQGRLFFLPLKKKKNLDPVSTLTCVRSISVFERHTPLECLHGAHNLIRHIMDAPAEGEAGMGRELLSAAFFFSPFFSCIS